ncbi:unnamed protein product [Prorocentrum cordatum]|nr:unnamed protein product [Polarella glacialis]
MPALSESLPAAPPMEPPRPPQAHTHAAASTGGAGKKADEENMEKVPSGWATTSLNKARGSITGGRFVKLDWESSEPWAAQERKRLQPQEAAQCVGAVRERFGKSSIPRERSWSDTLASHVHCAASRTHWRLESASVEQPGLLDQPSQFKDNIVLGSCSDLCSTRDNMSRFSLCELLEAPGERGAASRRSALRRACLAPLALGLLLGAAGAAWYLRGGSEGALRLRVEGAVAAAADEAPYAEVPAGLCEEFGWKAIEDEEGCIRAAIQLQLQTVELWNMSVGQWPSGCSYFRNATAGGRDTSSARSRGAVGAQTSEEEWVPAPLPSRVATAGFSSKFGPDRTP